MNDIFKNKNYTPKKYIKLLILLYFFNSTYSLLLNNIVRFSSKDFRYCHFSFNSDGDMIVDVSSYPVSSERQFFGIKKNGHYFFKDANNKETPYYTMVVDHSNGRIEGESSFIKLTSTSNINIHGTEVILGISKIGESSQGMYMELYNFNDNSKRKYQTSNALGNIVTDSFSIIKTPEESETYYYYTLTYIISSNNAYYLTLKKTYFSYDLGQGCNHVKQDSIQVAYHKMVSCFYTKKLKYICFYLNRENKLMARAYDSELSNPIETKVNKPPYTYPESIFFKSIHFKGEIGFYLYFRESNYLKFSILQCNDDRKMSPYSGFSEISMGTTTFRADNRLNDILKMNDFQIIYLSVDVDYNYFKFVTFTLYKNDTLINIRFYQIQMWPENSIKIFHDIKGGLYKNFISLAFSNCPEQACTTSGTDKIYSSLIIFCYANSSDNSLDIIPQLYETNKNIENDFSFNFEGKLIIENNFFGFIFKGTRIMKLPEGLNLTNASNGKNLEVESLILKEENLSLNFETHDNYEKKNYIIEYAYVLEEPNYEDVITYYTYIEDSRGNQKGSEKNYYKKYEYTGKSSNFTLIINENLLTKCYNDSCSLCFTNYTCITCKYNYTFNNNQKICLPNPYTPSTILTTIPTTIQTTIPTTILTTIPTTSILTTIPFNIPINSQQNYPIYIPTIIPNLISSTLPKNSPQIISTTFFYNSGECTENQILEGKCNGKMTNEQISQIYNKLRKKISPDANEVIETENVKFQLSTFEEQKNNNNPNISSIDLGECEERLKKQEGLTENDHLIILKIDIKNEDLSSTYVQYEIYNPKTLNIISLDICSDIPISVSVPVNLDENTRSIYDSLSKSGYNLFDLNDSFYNDICSTYTTEDGTDLTLADRKNKIFDNNANISMCQDGCNFQSYNLTTKKAKCDCSVQKEVTITDISKIKFDKNELVDSFFTSLKNSNFLVLKCYKLALSKIGQHNNLGSYIMTSITSIFIILMIIYIIKGSKKISFFIELILKQKLNCKSLEKEKSNKTKFNNLAQKNKNKNKKNSNDIYNNKNNKETKNIKNSNKKENKLSIKKNKKKSSDKEKNKNPPRKTSNSNNKIYSKKSMEKFLLLKSKEKERSVTNLVDTKNFKNKNLKNKKNNNNNKISINKNKAQKIPLVYPNNKTKNQIKSEKPKLKDLNDEELNTLEYEIAVRIDKRTYFQYYYSLLKKKQLLIFAFYPANDYNLMTVKVSLLLLAFSLYFTINGFFFSDETMNKINEDKGAYNILFQIPQILYSTLISAIINMILKRLSLSEKQIICIKLEKDFLRAQKKSKEINKCIKLKLVIFFILSFILMIFFWYFIVCFCAVYKNTQMILIKDTLISFALSMAYPFGLNLLPGMFRIPALRAPKKDKKCFYNISNIIALI